MPVFLCCPALVALLCCPALLRLRLPSCVALLCCPAFDAFSVCCFLAATCCVLRIVVSLRALLAACPTPLLFSPPVPPPSTPAFRPLVARRCCPVWLGSLGWPAFPLCSPVCAASGLFPCSSRVGRLLFPLACRSSSSALPPRRLLLPPPPFPSARLRVAFPPCPWWTDYCSCPWRLVDSLPWGLLGHTFSPRLRALPSFPSYPASTACVACSDGLFLELAFLFLCGYSSFLRFSVGAYSDTGLLQTDLFGMAPEFLAGPRFYLL